MAVRQATGPPGGEAGLSLPEQLEKLDELRRRGVISDAEFASTKTRLLGA
jgi:Short C-terminal domain